MLTRPQASRPRPQQARPRPKLNITAVSQCSFQQVSELSQRVVQIIDVDRNCLYSILHLGQILELWNVKNVKFGLKNVKFALKKLDTSLYHMVYNIL